MDTMLSLLAHTKEDFFMLYTEKQAEIAINRVIDYVDHPEKYKEFLEMRADIMLMKS